jgi:hypothetical protein
LISLDRYLNLIFLINLFRDTNVACIFYIIRDERSMSIRANDASICFFS